MRFTIEQIFLDGARGERPVSEPHYHLVEANSIDAAVHDFLSANNATLIGSIQKYPGYQAVVTARTPDAVFTMNLLPGSDTFHRHS